jgi:hypothetical protein
MTPIRDRALSLGKMVAEPPSREQLRSTFQRLFEPCSYPWTRHPDLFWLRTERPRRIDLVANEYPDAEAHCIAAAYDAFGREHGDDLNRSAQVN